MAASHELSPHSEYIPIIRKPSDVLNAFPSIARFEELYKDHLNSEIRYNRYRRPTETIEEWVQILGPDVLFRTHPYTTAEHAFSVITTQEAHGNQLSNSLRTKLYIAPFIHDWGELRVDPTIWLGDISYDKKTADDELVEKSVFDLIMPSIPLAERQLLRSVYTEIVMDRQSPMGRIFNAAERVGYMETAIRAYLGHRIGDEIRRIENWQGLVGNVLSNQAATFASMRNSFPYIDLFIDERGPIISAMFEEVTGTPPRVDREETLSFDVHRLEAAHAAWKRR